MKLYAIAGYKLEDGEILCPECHAESVDKGIPFLIGDEFDSAPTCSYCLYEIWEVTVTGQNNA